MKKLLSLLALLSAVSIVSNVSAQVVLDACSQAKANLVAAQKAFSNTHKNIGSNGWISLLTSEVMAEAAVAKACSKSAIPAHVSKCSILFEACTLHTQSKACGLLNQYCQGNGVKAGKSIPTHIMSSQSLDFDHCALVGLKYCPAVNKCIPLASNMACRTATQPIIVGRGCASKGMVSCNGTCVSPLVAETLQCGKSTPTVLTRKERCSRLRTQHPHKIVDPKSSYYVLYQLYIHYVCTHLCISWQSLDGQHQV